MEKSESEEGSWAGPGLLRMKPQWCLRSSGIFGDEWLDVLLHAEQKMVIVNAFKFEESEFFRGDVIKANDPAEAIMRFNFTAECMPGMEWTYTFSHFMDRPLSSSFSVAGYINECHQWLRCPIPPGLDQWTLHLTLTIELGNTKVSFARFRIPSSFLPKENNKGMELKKK